MRTWTSLSNCETFVEEMNSAKTFAILPLVLCVGLFAVAAYSLYNNDMEQQSREAFLYKWGWTVIPIGIAGTLFYFMI